jgi:hypothetical protein
LQKKCFLGLSCVSETNGPFIDGRTTGIEPAHGGFTIHCLDPLGYIRPYPRTGLSLYLRSDLSELPYDRYQRKAFSYTIEKKSIDCCVLELGETKLQHMNMPGKASNKEVGLFTSLI